MSLKARLYPALPRDFKGYRATALCARALHIICAGTIMGSFVLPTSTAAPIYFWYLASLSGAILIALDLYRTFDELAMIHTQISLLKWGTVIALFHFSVQSAWPWLLIAFISTIMSHAPRSLRHYALTRGHAIYFPPKNN